MTPPRHFTVFLREAWPSLLVLMVLVLLPVAHSSEGFIGIGAMAGLILAWRRRRELRALPPIRLAVVLFLCYWLPALISAPDSVATAKSWSTVRDLLRFLPFALFAGLSLSGSAVWPRLHQAIGAVVALWLVDAWVQALTGYSIGGPAEAERLSGVFGAGNLKLGPTLAVLSPFVLLAARERFARTGLVMAFLLLLVPVLLAGSRAAWVMFALVVVVVAWQEARAPARFFTWAAAMLVVVALVGAVALHDSKAFDARVERTLLALRGSEQSVDEASAGRVRIWTTAVRMIAAHPINGVGVRAFRYAYPKYADPNDTFVDRDSDEGASHAHQIGLEVLSETGVIGLVFWMAGAWVALRAWRRADAGRRARALAPALALATMTFPLNTHLAFYSAWWGLLFWWLLALYCAAVSTDRIETAHGA